MSQEVIIVAGLATKAENSVPLTTLAEAFRVEKVHYIDGAGYDENNVLTASEPSLQTEQVVATIEGDPSTDYLIISQSLGAIAAINSLESPNTRALLIAPPLPSPASVMAHPRIRNRLFMTDGQLTIPSYSFAPGERAYGTLPETPATVVIHPDYFEEIDEASADFLGQTEEAVYSGKAILVAPSRDWNKVGAAIARGFGSTIEVPGEHSLYSSQPELDRAARYIVTRVENGF